MKVSNSPYWQTAAKRYPSLQAAADELRTGSAQKVDISQWRDPSADDLQQADKLRQGLPNLQAELQAKKSEARRNLAWAGAAGLATSALAATSQYGLAAAALVWTLVPLTKAWGAGKVASKQQELIETQTQLADKLSTPTQLDKGKLHILSNQSVLFQDQLVAGGPDDARVEKVLQAHQKGVEAANNWSHDSIATYSVAAAIAGSPEEADKAITLGREFDHNWSHDSAATYSVAAAIAGTPEKARASQQEAHQLDGNWSRDSEATYSIAAAIAQTPEKLQNAAAQAKEFDGNWSRRSHSIFTIACAVADSPTQAEHAHDLGKKFDNNWSKATRATYTLAAAIAGDSLKAQHAYKLAKNFDRNWSHQSRSMYTVAAAIAGDPKTASLAHELAQVFDRNWSHDSCARYTIAAAAALNPDKAHFAAAFPPKED